MKNFKNEKSLEEVRQRLREFIGLFEELKSSCDFCLQNVDKLLLARKPEKVERLRKMVHGIINRLDLGRNDEDGWNEYHGELDALASSIYVALRSKESEKRMYAVGRRDEADEEEE